MAQLVSNESSDEQIPSSESSSKLDESTKTNNNIQTDEKHDTDDSNNNNKISSIVTNNNDTHVNMNRILPGTQLDDVIPTKLECVPIENELLKLSSLDNEITSLILTKYEKEINNYTNWPSFMVVCFVIAYRHEKNIDERKKITLEKFDKFINFYESSKFDNILENKDIINEYNLTIHDGAFKGLPLYMYGLDREGHPIYWQDGVCFFKLFETFGNIDDNSVNMHKADIYNAINWRRMFNLKTKLSKYYNCTLFYHTAVVDCKDMAIFETLDQFRKHYHFYQDFFGLTSDLFPENVYRIIMINAPYAFKISFSIVKKVLNPNTQRKMFVFGTDYIKDLIKLIDIDMIPPKHKGNGKWGIRMGNVPENFPIQTDDPFLPLIKE